MRKKVATIKIYKENDGTYSAEFNNKTSTGYTQGNTGGSALRNLAKGLHF